MESRFPRRLRRSGPVREQEAPRPQHAAGGDLSAEALPAASQVMADFGNQQVLVALGEGPPSALAALLRDEVMLAIAGVPAGTGDRGSNQAMQRRLSASTAGSAAPPGVGAVPAASGGAPLPEGVRVRMEQAFGHDFSHVRIHTGGGAGRAAADLEAHAFAVGAHVWFGAGEWAPGTPAGDRLLAHELTHVVQADEGRIPAASGGDRVSSPSDPTEREAYANEAVILSALAASPSVDAAAAVDAEVGADHTAGPTGGTAHRSPNPVPTARKSAAEIVGDGTPGNRGLTLTALEAYADAQADWFAEPSLTEPQRTQIRDVLTFTRTAPDVMTGCGEMHVGDLLAAGLADAVLTPLRAYARACRGDDTVHLTTPTDDVARGVALGTAITQLEVRIPGVQLKKVLRQDQLVDLLDHARLAGFLAYVDAFHPTLDGDGGVELDAYRSLVVDDAADPMAYLGLVPHVRNVHHFEKALLDAALTNFADRSKARPLVLVLHSTFDHNGAFHRDPNLTQVFTNATNLTLLIEGAAALSDITDQLRPLATAYGQGDRIAQVMIAGHGNARVVELAGSVSASQDPTATEVGVDRQDVDPDSPETQRMMDELLGLMVDDPAHPGRIVFNGCLTNSNDVAPEVGQGADPATAAQAVNDYIRDHASLATWLQQRADAQGRHVQSVGANASFGQVGLIDPATGQLDIVSGEDPALTSPKIVYVERGVEPLGAMRAVLQCWADPAVGRQATLDAMGRRTTPAPAHPGWNEAIIQYCYGRVIAVHSNDAAAINGLAQAAGAVSEVPRTTASGVFASVPTGEVDGLFTALAATPDWSDRRPVVVLQAWLARNPSKRPDFLTVLGSGGRTCASVRQDVDATLLAPLNALLPTPSAGTPPAQGPLLLGLLLAGNDLGALDPTVRAFLRGAANGQRAFPAALGVDGLLTAFRSAQEILDAIGLGQGATAPGASGAGPSAPDANVDRNLNGTNETRVEPMTRTGAVTAIQLNVRGAPSMEGRVLGTLAAGTSVNVAGRAGGWYGIEYAGAGAMRMAFVYGRYLQF